MTAPAYPTTAAVPPDGLPIQLRLLRSTDRNRLTTFFRALLVIPHYIVLYVLQIAASVVVFLVWVASLFIGRAPQGMREFLVGVLRWQTRVVAYYVLLTDDYPPFSLDPGGYAVDLDVPPPGKLNRAAVFFRIILIIPAYLLAVVTGIALYVLVIVAWFAGVLLGRVPDGVYDTSAAIVQYWTRILAYYWLITPTYPSQPFGPLTAPAPDGIGGPGWNQQLPPQGSPA